MNDDTNALARLTATEAADLIGVSPPTIRRIFGPAAFQKLVGGRQLAAWPRDAVEAYAAASPAEREALRFVPMGARGAPKKPDVSADVIAEIQKLRETGMSREKIAAKFGVPLSRVKRWIREAGLPDVREGRKSLAEHEAAAAALAPVPVTAPTLIDQAGVILAMRGVGILSRDGDILRLDGRRISEANVLRAAGLAAD